MLYVNKFINKGENSIISPVIRKWLTTLLFLIENYEILYKYEVIRKTDVTTFSENY